MIRFLLALTLIALPACKSGGDEAAGPALPEEGSAESPPEVEAEPGSGDGAAPQEVAAAEPQPIQDSQDTGPDVAEDLAPPTLPSLMRQAGFERASAADLAEFVHLPPGAEGEAGVFGEGERAVRIALIAYPNPRYVRPHVTDVRERIRVLPNPREAVLHHHRWVVHLMAVDRATADEAAERIRNVLAWQ